MAGSTFESNTLVGQRVGVTSGAAGDLLLDYSAGIQEGDIKINGQDVGAIADASDMETILKAINDNIDNVTASAFNVVVAKNVGTGVTTAGQMVIETLELGQGAGNSTTFNISASDSMEELVSNINNETGGVVQASLNSDGKLVLSNDTGATITVLDGSASATSYDGGSGFFVTELAYGGFIKLDSDDGKP